MTNKYFNVTEFQYAMKLLEKDPFEAKKRFDVYLDKYPHDFYARVYYIFILTRICMFDDAEKEYNELLNEVNNSDFYSLNASRLNGFKYNLCLATVKLLGVKGKYADILELIDHHKDMFANRGDNYVSYYCRSKLGLIDKEEAKINKNAYLFNQTVDYSEEAFRDHVKKHEADYNMDLDIPNDAVFSSDFPIDEIINEIKKYIPSKKRLFLGFFDDTYYFKYDNCGRVNNHVTDYFAVVCFHDTTNFITMYPDVDGKKLPHEDLNHIKKDEKETIENRPSQIDKFNRRFHR